MIALLSGRRFCANCKHVLRAGRMRGLLELLLARPGAELGSPATRAMARIATKTPAHLLRGKILTRDAAQVLVSPMQLARPGEHESEDQGWDCVPSLAAPLCSLDASLGRCGRGAPPPPAQVASSSLQRFQSSASRDRRPATWRRPISAGRRTTPAADYSSLSELYGSRRPSNRPTA